MACGFDIDHTSALDGVSTTGDQGPLGATRWRVCCALGGWHTDGLNHRVALDQGLAGYGT